MVVGVRFCGPASQLAAHVFGERTNPSMKHIDIRYHYIRELVEEKEVELYFIDGNNNPADMFTKNLGRVKFEKFRSQLGLEFNSS